MPEKVVPVVLRQRGETEILGFVHPLAGRQVVKGTIEPGESPEAAALRELAEEAGITGVRATGSLGRSSDIVAGETWHFVRVAVPELPEHWVHHTADDGGRDFDFFWQSLQTPPDVEWHENFQRALTFIRDAVG
jgi:8-oxo-dGTP pyrophosphatase MutT (NUDIX family)